MRLAHGARVGTFEIVAPLGAGGMGEVYRARDTKLNREVALKVLPEDFALDSDRLARFRREAQLLASLNHPNIAAIHGLEESSGISALVLELVEGPTLADRIGHGPIPIDEALPIAKQIAEALEAAHDRGVVHRDLKPANIKIRADGTVKVLDFGLAKALEGDMASPDVSQSPTLTVAGTRVGVILGTAAYMAPEQARGKAVDKRADVWAFGCVVYEILTGRRAFAGDEVSDILASVLARDPDLASLPADTPASIRRLVRRCLQKDRKERLHDIADARLELHDAHAPQSSDRGAALPVDRVRQRLRFAVVAAGGLVVGAAVAIGMTTYLRPTAVDVSAMRFTVAPPDGWRWPTPNSNSILSLSPDGRRIALVARSVENTDHIWIRSLDTLTLQELAGTDGANSPFWSPDGQSVAFFADGKLKKIAVAGGPALTLCDAPTARGGAWSREGVIVFGNNSGPLQRVSEAGGPPTAASALAHDETSHLRPSFLPDGRHFLFAASTGTARPRVPIFVGSLDSADRTRLMDADATNVYYSQTHLLFLREMTLWAQPFDAGRLTLTGEAFPIAETIAAAAAPATAMFSASERGVFAFQTGPSLRSRLVWFDRTGKQTGTVGDEASYIDLEMSPDSTQVAVSVMDPTRRTTDMWIYDVERGVRRRLTSEPTDNVEPVWSPDGARVLFVSRRKGFLEAYLRNASDGSETALIEDSSNKYPTSWSQDGRFIMYGRGAPGVQTGVDLWFLPLSGDRKPMPFIQTKFNEGWPRFSPDGRWLAYRSDESGRYEIHVVSFPKPERKFVLSNTGGESPRWRRDGREIFFVAPDNKLMAAAVDGRGSTLDVGAVEPLFDVPPKPQVINGYSGWRYDVTADGQRFLVDVPVEQATTRPLTIVANWTAGVKK